MVISDLKSELKNVFKSGKSDGNHYRCGKATKLELGEEVPAGCGV